MSLNAARTQSPASVQPTPCTSARTGYSAAISTVPAMNIGFTPKRLAGHSKQRPHAEAAADDRGFGEQHDRHGHARPQQEDEEEDAACAGRERADAGVQIDAIDRVVGEERHGRSEEELWGESGACPLRRR